MRNRLPLGLTAIAILIRWLVAQFPYSGYNNPPMFGDYEAQRHWMEITTSLDTSDWYKNGTDNDLLYWGLDYPPLTAYHMYALGVVSKKFINSSWTELHKSRGFESHEHKLFMRLTVMISELAVYTPAVIYYFYKTAPIQYSSPPSTIHRHNIAIYTALMLLYPAQILVDHGHFQYNSVFMGLSLWAIIFMIKNRQFLSSMTFTLALSYKQMSLYYALPFFWFIASKNLRIRPVWKGLRNIILVGLLVMCTFALIFAPFLNNVESVLQVIRRIFPINRGLFEDKVANFWFSLSVFYKLKKLYSPDDLLKASTALTLLATLPAGIHLLIKPTIRTFKYSLVTTSLAFFLFSFQVHEKTILVPALPLLLMAREHPLAANWFAIISTFSLQPLLMKDGQLVPYLVLMSIQTLLTLETFRAQIAVSQVRLFTVQNFVAGIYYSSIIGCFTLSLAAICLEAPSRYPHIHTTMNAIYSFAHFFMFLLFFYYSQFKAGALGKTSPDRVMLLKKTN